VTPKYQTRDPRAQSHYLENSWRCYLATTANLLYLVCCEAVRSAILATAWFLVHIYMRFLFAVFFLD